MKSWELQVDGWNHSAGKVETGGLSSLLAIQPGLIDELEANKRPCLKQRLWMMFLMTDSTQGCHLSST